MLRTFDDSLITTAVQQLTTDLDSMAARIKKLEEGGNSGFALVLEHVIENQESITSTSITTIETLSMPEGFSIANDEMLLAITTLENEEAHPKVLKTVTEIFNLSGKTSGQISSSLHVLYLNSSGTEAEATTQCGVWVSQYNITDNTITLSGRYSSTYGYAGGKVTTKVYKIKLPA